MLQNRIQFISGIKVFFKNTLQSRNIKNTENLLLQTDPTIKSLAVKLKHAELQVPTIFQNRSRKSIPAVDKKERATKSGSNIRAGFTDKPDKGVRV